MLFYNGMAVIENSHLTDKVQSKRHHKKRINKKWLKRYGYKYVPSKKIFFFNNQFIMHPTLIKQLKNKIKNH